MVAEIVGLAVGSSVNYAQAIAQVVDFYLDDARSAERQQIQMLVTENDDVSMELLRGYVREAQSKLLVLLDIYQSLKSMRRIKPSDRGFVPYGCWISDRAFRQWQVCVCTARRYRLQQLPQRKSQCKPVLLASSRLR